MRAEGITPGGHGRAAQRDPWGPNGTPMRWIGPELNGNWDRGGIRVEFAVTRGPGRGRNWDRGGIRVEFAVTRGPGRGRNWTGTGLELARGNIEPVDGPL